MKMESMNPDQKFMRDNNKECARIFDGLRGVWNKWKKQFSAHNINHQQWITLVLETSRELFEREIRCEIQ